LACGTRAVDELFKDPTRKTAALTGANNSSRKKRFLARIVASSLRKNALEAAAPARAPRSEILDAKITSSVPKLAAIYPAMMNSIFALWPWGTPGDPLTWREIKEFSRFEVEEATHSHAAVRLAGLGHLHRHGRSRRSRFARGSSALVKAADWMLSKQVLGPGDWQVKNKDAEPGGWRSNFAMILPRCG